MKEHKSDLRRITCLWLFAVSFPLLGNAQGDVNEYLAQMARDQKAHPTMQLGTKAPDFSLMGTNGEIHTLADYDNRPLLAIVFISNHCPASQLYEARIKAIVDDYSDRGVQVVAIAPNGPEAVSPHELNYTDVGDAFEDMVIRAEHRDFNFPYLYDGDTQAIAHQFGPKVTPHIYIFDEQRKLRYEGRIDDHMRAERAGTHDARNAIESLLAGKEVAVPHTAVFGCSTKWNSHIDNKKREMREWMQQPIEIEMVSADGLSELRKNRTGKTLMINFWATWCAPCQYEYPELLTTHLWYRSRDFEFVSVAFNTPEEQEAVKNFLDKKHSAVRNLLIDNDDVYGMMAAFDPTWESGVPFTIVLSPDGEVIYRREGVVDILDMRRTILANLPDAGMFAGNAAYWRE